MRRKASWRIRQFLQGPWGFSGLIAGVCVLSGLGASWLSAVGAGSRWQFVWVAAVAGVSFGLAWVAFRRWEAHDHLVNLAEQVIQRLDGQSQSLRQQTEQIERLRSVLADEALRHQIEEQLGGTTQSAMSALIGALAQAEDAVPEAASVTKSWISRARHLADQTRSQIEQVREDHRGD